MTTRTITIKCPSKLGQYGKYRYKHLHLHSIIALRARHPLRFYCQVFLFTTMLVSTVLPAAVLLFVTTCLSAPTPYNGDLEWKQCPTALVPSNSTIRCGYIEVPINWDNPNDGQKVTLGMVKLPAKNPAVSPKFADAVGSSLLSVWQQRIGNIYNTTPVVLANRRPGLWSAPTPQKLYTMSMFYGPPYDRSNRDWVNTRDAYASSPAIC